MNTGGNLITMFLIYLLGRYLNKDNYTITMKVAFLLFGLSFVSLIMMMYYYYIVERFDSIWRLLNYNNPLVIIMAISLFYFVKSIKITILPQIALFLGRHSLSIYMFTEIIGLALYKYWAYLLDYNMFIYLLSVLSLILLIEVIDVPYLWINGYIRKHVLRK